MNGDNVTYLHSFGVVYIPKETKKIIGSKIITIDIYGIQGSIISIYISPNEYENNDKVILEYFQQLETENFFSCIDSKRWQ